MFIGFAVNFTQTCNGPVCSFHPDIWIGETEEQVKERIEQFYRATEGKIEFEAVIFETKQVRKYTMETDSKLVERKRL